MRIAVKMAGLMVLGAELIVRSCAGENAPDVNARLKSFAAAKEKQAQSLAAQSNDQLPPEFQSFFSDIQNDNWEDASNQYFQIKYLVNASTIYHKSWWQPVVETFGAEDQFRSGNEKYFTAYANDIIQSIPPGSIYFGGTDPGRFIITGMQKSQIDDDPFFTLTQNALADDTYLGYLRSMYGGIIYVPTVADSRKCYNLYYADVQERMRKNQLQPGEYVTVNPNTGKMQISGEVAVMNINALLVRTMFDKNPDRGFYIEESFPLAWMYPYLEPHGLIFKLNHQALDELSDDAVQHDHDYWTKTISPMIGDWLKTDTSIKDISAFAEKVFVQHDFSGFTGDRDFVQNAYSYKTFSKARSSIGGLYAWRAQHAADPAEKQRMYNEADFAFRQSWALYPASPETVFRYVQFLMQSNRVDDALIVARTSLSLEPTNSTVSNLVANLEQSKERSASQPHTLSELLAMEDEARTNPTDYTNIFALAGYYVQNQQTNRATELLQKTVSRPDVSAAALRSAAQYFAQAGDFSDLRTTIKKLAVAEPHMPETWYDLARLDMRMGNQDEALKSLRIAIDLSDQRLQTNPRAYSIRAAARLAPEFDPIRNGAEFRLITQ